MTTDKVAMDTSVESADEQALPRGFDAGAAAEGGLVRDEPDPGADLGHKQENNELLQSRDRRLQDLEISTDGAALSPGPPGGDQEPQLVSQAAAAGESAPGLSPTALLERLRLMWRNGAGLPVRSGLPRAAAALSWQLCVNARQAREDYLKESSVLAEGLLAREEMTGYIIGDAVDLPVMPAKKAMAVCR